MRFALAPDGVIVADLSAKLPGRGAWTRASRSAVIAAASKGLFARAFDAEARMPADATPESFALSIERGLEQKALAALGLARRAGKAQIGYDQAEGLLRAGNAAALIVAFDASQSVAAKLVRLAGEAPIVTAFSQDALSVALGREKVTYAALEAGAEATRFLREATRLAGFRTVFAARAVEA